MQIKLEVLAPAKDSAIGTAAIECGADAVYIAGPRFGARVAAGNSVDEIAKLCRHAHLFGVKVYSTVNTLIREDEMADVERLIREYYEAGVDAVIVQDMNLLRLNLPPIALHASTQAVVRTPERARELEKAGFERIILERQISLDQIREIRKAVDCELEFFVHGALCMSYSGECYLSEVLTGRSANRGCCAQPCRSLYDVYDVEGRLLAAGSHILSMKDLRLDNHIADLALAGINSFKIEGRLKNASYVKNVVRHYRNVVDSFIADNHDFSKSSYGEITGGFVPDPDATFNRGYSSCFITGKREKWNSVDSAKSVGEFVGNIEEIDVKNSALFLSGGAKVSNGDGLVFTDGNNTVGMRSEVVNGKRIVVKDVSHLCRGMKCFRNMNIRFERELEKNMPRRLMEVKVDYMSIAGKTVFSATLCNGKTISEAFDEKAPLADKPERALEILRLQIEKTTGPYRFVLGKVDSDKVYSYSASFLNSVRRTLAEKASESSDGAKTAVCLMRDVHIGNISTAEPGRLLMKSKYCVRYELGMCTKSGSKAGPLFIVNNGRKLRLEFDCKNCEMSVSL